MKKFIQSMAVVAIVSVSVFFACEKEQIKENQETEIVNNIAADADEETRRLGGDAVYVGNCGLCFRRTLVCIEPPNCESWACYELGGGFYFQRLSLVYKCADGSFNYIELFTFTNSTPMETQCVYVNLPVNTPVVLVRNAGCGGHDFLCDLDLSFSTSGYWGCTTLGSYDSNGGEWMSIMDRDWFEICSNVACAIHSEDDKKKVDFE